MKKNILNLYKGFFDDLDKLNQDKVNDEFGRTNANIYDEHDVILSKDKNPEFFEGLCNMCEEYDLNLPSNENWFTQKDLDQITYIKANKYSDTFFENITSLDELQYFHNLKEINTFCFGNCKIKSIIFPENLLYIFKDAFHCCTYLEKVIFPENLEEIYDYCFYNCTSLKEINIPKNIKNIGDCAFSGCSSLKEIVIPKNIKNIGDFAFEHCFSLEKIIIPERFENSIHSIFHKVDLSKVNITYI